MVVGDTPPMPSQTLLMIFFLPRLLIVGFINSLKSKNL